MTPENTNPPAPTTSRDAMQQCQTFKPKGPPWYGQQCGFYTGHICAHDFGTVEQAKLDWDATQHGQAAPSESEEFRRAAERIVELTGGGDSGDIKEVQDILSLQQQLSTTREQLAQAKELQDLTLSNEIRWMQKHEALLGLIETLRQWKSPDGVLQVKDLKWFQGLPMHERDELRSQNAALRESLKDKQRGMTFVESERNAELVRRNEILREIAEELAAALEPFAAQERLVWSSEDELDVGDDVVITAGEIRVAAKVLTKAKAAGILPEKP